MPTPTAPFAHTHTHPATHRCIPPPAPDTTVSAGYSIPTTDQQSCPTYTCFALPLHCPTGGQHLDRRFSPGTRTIPYTITALVTVEWYHHAHITHCSQCPGHATSISEPNHVTQLGVPRRNPPPPPLHTPPRRLCSFPNHPVVPVRITRDSPQHYRHSTTAHTLFLSPPSPWQVHCVAPPPP